MVSSQGGDDVTSVTSSDQATFASKGKSLTIDIHQLYVKKLPFVTLDRENYISWKSQASTILRGTDLLKFIEGEVDSSTDPILKRQDQLILGWLFSALSPPILSQIVSLSSPAQVWKALATLFSSGSVTHVMFLQRQFLTVKKGTKSMAEYLTHIRRMLDELIGVGEKLKEYESTLNVIGGLGMEYESLVTSRFDHETTSSIFEHC